MVLVKECQFSTFFLGNIVQENMFYHILELKTPFLAIQARSSKGGKIDIFPKGLTHCFGPKMAIFQLVFLGQCIQRKCVLPYSRTKKSLFWL